ncbi:hypothetical protein [Metallibacterium sp.]|jgi:hypothetical protein|uniref:hypothetical protein n=1 Tax=Metallibacterium sp. TaxID=2940281 RepID=UPI002620FA0B|nr:hypothetical protein [Metallibacterium sp.]
MSHPLMYVLGKTQKYEFPLILVIGREPNYDGWLNDSIGIMKEEFRSMRGGAWVTAYTQIAKQCLGDKATAGQLKGICFARNASPIVFSNALPMAIPHSVKDKDKIRNELSEKDIRDHIVKIFEKPIADRFGLVVQHGAYNSGAFELATKLIKQECAQRSVPYCSSPFFWNGHSKKIQECLSKDRRIIQSIFEKFDSVPDAR